MTATYRDLTALRRPDADHRDLPTAILPTAAIARRATTTEPPPAERTARYVGQHRRGGTR